MEAVFRRRKELVKYILTYPDVNINYKNEGNFTALHII